MSVVFRRLRVYSRAHIPLACAVAYLSCFVAAHAATWDGTSGNWTNSAKWSPTVVPTDSTDVILPVGAYTLTLSGSTSNLNSYTQNGGTLFFTNWATALRATTATISGGTMNHALCDTNAAASNTNRVYIIGSNVTIGASGGINVNERGFPGAPNTGLYGQGPSGAYGTANDQGGGGHGAAGGTAGAVAGGPANDLTNAATLPGSGGGSDGPTKKGGAGGGVVRIAATGRVTVDGTITANGKTVNAGAGAGGSIWISCDTFTGTGLLRAMGGNGSTYRGGGGGGGRVAITYDSSNQAAAGLTPTVQFAISGGSGGSVTVKAGAQAGTLYLQDAQFLPCLWPGGAVISFGPGVTSVTKSYPDMQFDDGRVEYPDMPIDLTVTGKVTVSGSFNRSPYPDGVVFGYDATLAVGGDLTVSNGFVTIGTNLSVAGDVLLDSAASLFLRSLTNLLVVATCGGNFTMTPTSKLYVYAADTNASYSEYGALVDIDGNMILSGGSWVYPRVWNSLNTNNTMGTVKFCMTDLNVASNAGFNANNAGYSGGKTNWHWHGFGPGGGYNKPLDAGGGGYGGTGGLFFAAGPYGHPYGSATNANLHGSGGSVSGDSRRWPNAVGAGGGAIWIQAAGNVTMDGTLTANGESNTKYNGPGSGGGILVQTAGSFSGATGSVMRANGGTGKTYHTGGGGGGRIAVWYEVKAPSRDLIMQGQAVDGTLLSSSSYDGFDGNVTVDPGIGSVNGTAGTIVFLTVIPPGGTVITVR